MRRNDHSTIGGVLAAVLVPAIFWKRAGVVNRMLFFDILMVLPC